MGRMSRTPLCQAAAIEQPHERRWFGLNKGHAIYRCGPNEKPVYHARYYNGCNLLDGLLLAYGSSFHIPNTLAWPSPELVLQC